MKLEKFVEESLKQIINGVQKAKEHGSKNGASINPISTAFSSSNQSVFYCTETGIPLQQIEFDVAVTISQSSSQTNDGRTEIGDITVSGLSTENSATNSTASRIKFTVPIRLPVTEK